MELCKGANAPVPTSLLAVVLSWRSSHAIDAHALLLDESGTVRDDSDLVFFNAPRHISQAVTLNQDSAPGTARLSVSLPRTQADVDRIAVTGSLDAGSFDEISDLQLTVWDADQAIVDFPIADSEAVSAMLFGEFYRRDAQWRFRAVAQGWDSGMAGLVTEFGIEINDEPTAVQRSTSGVDQPENAPTEQQGRAATQHGSGSASRSTPGTNGSPATHSAPPGNSGHSPDLLTATTTTTRAVATGLGPSVGPHDATGSRSARITLQRQARPEPPAEPPPNRDHADWHPDNQNPNLLRWWDSERWTSETRLARPQHPRNCARCATPRRRRIFGGYHSCSVCPEQIDEFLTHWHGRAWRVLTTSGPSGEEWAALWASLRYQWIDESAGYAVLRALGFDYVERRVAFAFADGEIEADEYDAFEHAVAELRLTGPQIDDLRWRMQRGRMLTRLRSGELPTVDSADLHLDAEEWVHLDTDVVHIRELAKGPKHTDGRLIVTNKKLRFVGSGSGVEMPWSRIVSVTVEDTAVVVAATSSRGGATFGANDPEYVAAAIEGTLRVAKRLALVPGQRDTRSISQEVKAEVWQRDGGKCVECSESHYLEFDHIIPLSRGGATSATNLQILCRGCNRAKGARI